MKRLIKSIPNIVLVAMMGGIIANGCANRGSGPQGGPKDSIPPRILKEIPFNKQVQFNSNKFEIQFDEIVVLDKVTDNVIVSPPLKKATMPKAYGKKIVMQFTDTLKPGKTYVVDFGNAIVDNNEGNPIRGYSYSFSTGPLMDTLQISGYVLDAATLDPCVGIIVGAHVDMTDSSFTTIPFDIVAKTDAKGHFCIKNAKEGSYYKVFALKDINGNYMYDMSGEEIAFNDTTYFPIMWSEERNDTIKSKNSNSIDSIHNYRIPIYQPNDILLRLFKEEDKVQKFIKGEREMPYKFSLYFNAPLETLPQLNPLNFKLDSNNYLIDLNTTKDTITYWLLDSLEYRTDTLTFELFAPKTDSIGELITELDTIRLVTRMEIKSNTSNSSSKGKKNKKDNTPKIEFLKMQNNIKGTFNVYDSIVLRFDSPIKSYIDTMIHLAVRKDSTWESIPISMNINKLQTSFSIVYDWKPEAEYLLNIDSAAFTEWYGKWTNKLSTKFKIRSLEEYGNLYVILPNFTGKEVIQLLDKKEKVIRESKVTEEITTFEYLEPNEYYLRLFIDENENGLWDSGKYVDKKQPEMTYYYPNKVTIRAYWDVEEEWDYKKVYPLRQKPEDLKKKDSSKKR